MAELCQVGSDFEVEPRALSGFTFNKPFTASSNSSGRKLIGFSAGCRASSTIALESLVYLVYLVYLARSDSLECLMDLSTLFTLSP